MPDTFIIAELNKYTLEFAASLQKALYAGGFRYVVEVVPPKAPTIPCGSISAELHIVEISSGENRATLWTNSRSSGISVSARYHDGSKFGKDFFYEREVRYFQPCYEETADKIAAKFNALVAQDNK